MIRAKCKVKLTEKKNSLEYMNFLGMEETLDKLIKVERVW